MVPVLLLAIALFMSVGLARADVLRCPYDEGVHGMAHLRSASLNRPGIREQIEAVLGPTDPWQQIYEERNPRAGRTAPSLVRVQIDLEALPAPTRQTILAPLPEGAGCEVITRMAPAIPARTPRFENGRFTYDHDAPDRAEVDREAHGRPRDSRWNGLLWSRLAAVWDWLQRPAWAIPAFPHNSSVIQETCDATESPISSGGRWQQLATTYNRAINSTGGNCVGGATGSNAARYWTVAQGANVDLYLIYSTSGVGELYTFLFARIQQPGTTTYDAYNCLLFSTFGAANDQMGLYRDDDGGGTQVGASITQEVEDNGGYGCRFVGANVTFYVFTGSWTAVASRGPADMYGAGNVGFGLSNNTQTINYVSWATLSQGALLGRYLLRGR